MTPWLPLSLLGLALLSPACEISHTTTFVTEDDRLREKNLALTEQLGRLKQTIDTQRQQIDSLEQRLDTKTKLPDVATSLLPRLSSVEYGRYSGAVDTNGDGRDDTLRLYVMPRDQSGRFILCVARAVVQAVAIEPGQSPRVVAERDVSFEEFDRAYRHGLTGTHYTIEVPLSDPLPKDFKEATVKITLTDAASGVVLTHEKPIKINSRPS